jgi:hypothetical protein
MVYQGRLSRLCLSPVEVSQLVDFCQTVILGDGTQGTAQGLTAATPAKARIAVAVAERETVERPSSKVAPPQDVGVPNTPPQISYPPTVPTGYRARGRFMKTWTDQ